MANPRSEKKREQQHARKPAAHAQAYGMACREIRVIWRKLNCLNPSLRKVQMSRLPERRLKPVPVPAAGCPSACRNPPGAGAMPRQGIQGDERGASVTLERTTLTNAGSPKGRESYGDRVPILVAGVMTCQGGRESRPQGEGAQATDDMELRGMRNAGRRNGTCRPPRARQERTAV